MKHLPALAWAIIFGVSSFQLAAYAEGKKLTIERIQEDPSLEGLAPKNLKFSPDGSRVTFLKGKKTDFDRLDLWEFNLKDQQSRILVDSDWFLKGQEKLSAEEKSRRERLRIRESGIVEYFWSKSGNALVFPLNGALYYLETGKTKPKKLTDGTQEESDVHVSPNGKYVSFVRKGNLFVVDVARSKEAQLTRDGSAVIKNGVAEFIAQEEMDRFDGHWWSPDDSKIAFLQTNEGGVEVAKRYEIMGDGFEVFEQRYPRAGTANAKMRLGVIEISAHALDRPSVKWLPLGADSDIYVPRVQWLPDSKRLSAQIESRDQKRLDLVVFDTSNASKATLLTEKDPHWIELHSDLKFLEKTKRFIWSSERSGFRHLYLYEDSGKLIRQLTSGNWPVRAVEGVDEEAGAIYFTASVDTPVEEHLYRLPLEGGEIKRITQEAGWHRIKMPEKGAGYIDAYSNPLQPTRVSVHSAAGERLTYIEENRVEDAHHPLNPYLAGFTAPEFGSFKAPSGVDLYYRIQKPKDFKKGTRYPLIVDVYGGPTAQMARNAWVGSRGLWHQILADRGFLVLSVDNRGSSNRGRAFNNPIYRLLGQVEVEDQKAAVQHFISQGLVDPDRVGIFGWSYGGYMVLMSLLKEPEVFKVGVSVAPVSDWSLYDTHYTERYLGKPSENKDGYRKSGVLEYVDRLKGKLLMVHGMADDNVLFTNSTKVYQAFQERAIPFEMMAYPGSKHGIYGKKQQTHLFKMITDYFERYLKAH